MGGNPLTAGTRFWAKVNKEGDGCWEWTGAKFMRGYGKIWVGDKCVYAHRLSWSLNNGEIPDGLSVCHKCDNKQCVRPSHLFLGTHEDNMLDMKIKGRRKGIGTGEDNGRAKLTKEQVIQIRQSDEDPTETGKRFGIHRNTVNTIRRRESWKEVVDHCHRITTEENSETCQRSSTSHIAQASKSQATSQEPMHA